MSANPLRINNPAPPQPPAVRAEAGELPELLDVATITARVVPVSGRTWWRWVSSKLAPAADVKVTGKAVFWRRATIEEWLRNQNAKG